MICCLVYFVVWVWMFGYLFYLFSCLVGVLVIVRLFGMFGGVLLIVV